ncbi:MAG: NAD(P)-dependent oxidoreductase [Hungatella hathewayi]|uniref:NAD(P)-dependent oxidoreductase n=1 Tax=Hungatella TaxID=1649459 RepID=UPI0011DCA794|nr:NAD(P)-dependent oxidoreductase [Hungatella hathewayi]MDU4977234.1 NAD(P)-dependent oxidoreductase [Hungatella hathewayi]
MKQLGFIGLGKMGRGMCGNLMKKGYHLHIYDQSEAAIGEFASGADVCAMAAEVMDKSEIVFLSLPSSLVVEQVIGSFDAESLKGKTCVDMSTGDPFYAKKFYEFFRERGGAYADSPVTGDPASAARGEINTAFGGDMEVFEQVEPFLSAFCRNCVYMGGPGMGDLTKLAANYIGIQYITIYTQIFALAERMEMEPQKLYDFVLENTGMGCGAMKFHGPKIISGNREVAFAADLALKDLLYAKKLFDHYNAPSFTLDGAITLLRTALKDGGKGKDITVCTEVMKEYLKNGS